MASVKKITIKRGIIAIENLKKYLEMNPEAGDKETVEELIKDCENFGKEEAVEETKTIKAE